MNCPYCKSEANLKLENKRITYRKEEFDFFQQFYKCGKCNQEFTTTEIDEVNINQVYNQYREKYQIPFPEQLKNIRQKYGLTPTKMSEILGFGINIYRNYEKGEVPNLSNGTLLNLVRTPDEFSKIIENKKHLFSSKQFVKLTTHIEKLIEQEKKTDNYKKFLWDENIIPNEFTGYKTPSFDKFANMVLFFLENNPNLFKVRLNKLLFYSDFYHYKKFGFSISGFRYQAIQMGPVPYRYDVIYDLLWEENYIEYELADINENMVDKPIPKITFNEKVFEKSELETLTLISNKLKKLSKDELVDISHNEKCWIEEHKQKGIISYKKYGFELKIS